MLVENKIKKIISTNIKAYRVKRGLSQGQLGDLVGVQQVTVSRWESGIIPITAETLYQVSEILNTDISCFFND